MPQYADGSSAWKASPGAVLDVDAQLRGLAGREVVQDARDGLRDAGAHEHEADAGEHRAEERRQRRELDLLEVVDAHGMVVTLPGEEDLGEVARDGEILGVPGRVDVITGLALNGASGALPPGTK